MWLADLLLVDKIADETSVVPTCRASPGSPPDADCRRSPIHVPCLPASSHALLASLGFIFAEGNVMADRAVDKVKLNVFISYSRDDIGFADQLDTVLKFHGIGTMLDRHGISGGEDWRRRLGNLIRDADTIAFVLSPSSAMSDVCAWEVAEASRLRKRIIPVVCRSLAGTQVPKQLAELNYVYFYEEPKAPGSGFGTGQVRLLAALNTDLDWLREHTRLLQRASEWEVGGRPENRLLSGTDIAAAKNWAARRPTDAPDLTGLHLEFIKASELAEILRADTARLQLEAIAAAQEERAKALATAEAAQMEREIAQGVAADAARREAEQARRVARRTFAGLAAALVLALAAGVAGLVAYNNQRAADEQRSRAERNLAAVTEALALLDGVSDPKQLAPKFFALAHNYFKEERFDQAILLYQRSLAMAEKQFGTRSIESAAARTQLGLVQKQLKRYQEAESYLTEAISTYETLPIAENSDVPIALLGLAGVYRASGRLNQAKVLEQKVRRIGLAGSAALVNVFFGTDRRRGEAGDYGPERGQQLEFGRVIVTIPKSHVVSKIERPWSVQIAGVSLYHEVEDPKKHFTISELSRLPRDEFVSAIKDKIDPPARDGGRAFIFIHGWNTTFQGAIYRAAHLAHNLGFEDAPIVYSWPSGGSSDKYLYDADSTLRAGPYFKEFLDLVAEKTGATRISVIAYSMGSRLLLPVLSEMRRSSPNSSRLDQVILVAPDMDGNQFKSLLAASQGVAKGITLYASGSDRTLALSKRLSNGAPRAGDVPPTGPLVVPGVDTIDVTALTTDALSLPHAMFNEEDQPLLADIRQLISTGTRPPDRRLPMFARASNKEGDYWVYRPK